MCGIAGIFHSAREVDESHLLAMTQRLGHRGPDHIQVWVDGSIGLGHSRLSIIDLTGGDQPLFAEDGNLVLVANGEIYNHIELRKELEALGAVFITHSDSETILHAYRHFGATFLDKIHGMFAFALYDKNEGRLLLARDRLGIKPLFFAITTSGLVFASEQKALFPSLDGGIVIRPQALIQSLQTGFNTGSHCLAKGIERLQAGELAVFEQGRLASRRRYWSALNVHPRSMSYQEAAEMFEGLMDPIMQEHMRSDVPFALFLSGGTDSSVVLEWLRREGVRDLAVFTLAFHNDPNQDDRKAAQTIARRCGLRHHLTELEFDRLFEHLPFAIWAADDFIIDHAILPTSLLAREAARDFKVVFSGEGGDELFAGYGRYRRTQSQRWLANWLRPGSGGFRTRGQLSSKLARSFFSDALLAHADAGRQGFIEAWRQTPSRWSELQKMQFTDLTTELVDQLLVKVDRMLMAWGLEGRVPLLDHRLVEFALSLPDGLKVRGREGKYFLKRWASPIFGDDVIRRPKRGFSVNIAQCFQGDTLSRLGQVLPKHRALDGWFRPEAVSALIERQASQKGDVSMLWALLQFVLWHRIFVEGQGERPEVFADPIAFIASRP